jgi:hypothetical protein
MSNPIVCIQISSKPDTYTFSGKDLPDGLVEKSYPKTFNPSGFWPPALGTTYAKLPEEDDTEVTSWEPPAETAKSAEPVKTTKATEPSKALVAE